MRKIGLFLVITLTAVSCEIQQPNGPKVSDESLKDELETLTEFATFEPMRALSLILELGDNVIGNTDLRIGLFTHTDTNTWELMAAWDEGGSGIEAHRKATSPICFTKREDGSWLIDYTGDGMEYHYYENLSYTTTASIVDDSWHISTIGRITDKEGYEMSFGSNDITLKSSVIEVSYGKQWIILASGHYSLTITKDGEAVSTVTENVIENKQTVRYYDEYIAYYRTDLP